MNQQSATTSTNISKNIKGLILSGTIIDRVKRMVPRDNPTTEIVTYTIQDDYNRKFYVDDYAPNQYHALNETVCLPVYIKAYTKRNGDASYTLNVQKTNISRGQHF